MARSSTVEPSGSTKRRTAVVRAAVEAVEAVVAAGEDLAAKHHPRQIPDGGPRRCAAGLFRARGAFFFDLTPAASGGGRNRAIEAISERMHACTHIPGDPSC